MSVDGVLKFWFEELRPADWFSNRIDEKIRDRFLDLHRSVSQGECWQWRDRAVGRLAEIIVLDQFSRNIFRGRPEAFAQDAMALALAQESIRIGIDKDFSVGQKSFLYMPFMHSESRIIHETAIQLFSEPGLEGNLDYELRHKKIIDRFGRYPHRNIALGRTSTLEEVEFLKGPDSSF